jgi:hypothetical protein
MLMNDRRSSSRTKGKQANRTRAGVNHEERKESLRPLAPDLARESKRDETRPPRRSAQSSKRKLEKNFSTDRMDLGSGAHEHTIPMLITHGISHWEKR